MSIQETTKAEVQQTKDEIIRTKDQVKALIRELVIDDERIDVLTEHVLGVEPQEFHREMLEFQSRVQEGMILGWRGCGKTTYLTIARCLFEIIKNPNVRILLVADAQDQAKTILRSIKAHLEHNETFKSIFGDYVTGARLWTETEITVNKRSSFAGEPTIMVAGIGTTLPSRHYDVIICDDLVTEDNSVTEGLRNKTHTYFYKTLLPTLESPWGRLWIIGTRWHDEDLYGWLAKEDYAEATLVIGVLDDNDESRWPEKFPTARMHRIRKGNLASFELQYQCESGVTMGGIFNAEHFVIYDTLPSDVFKWQGVDVAAGQKDRNDFFAHCTIAVHKTEKRPYLIDYKKEKLPFPKQLRLIAAKFKAHPDVVRIVVESNAYQIVVKQQMNVDYPDVPIVARYTVKDKIARANQLSTIFTDRPLYVRREHHDLVRLLCGFPNIKGSKDVFDALEMALGQGLHGARKRRRKEPGLMGRR